MRVVMDLKALRGGRCDIDVGLRKGHQVALQVVAEALQARAKERGVLNDEGMAVGEVVDDLARVDPAAWPLAGEAPAHARALVGEVVFGDLRAAGLDQRKVLRLARPDDQRVLHVGDAIDVSEIGRVVPLHVQGELLEMLREEVGGIARREHKLERRTAVYNGIHSGFLSTGRILRLRGRLPAAALTKWTKVPIPNCVTVEPAIPHPACDRRENV